MTIQLNYLIDQGGFVVRPDGTFAVDHAKIKEGVAALTREIMTLQAEGSYEKAKALGDRLGVAQAPGSSGAQEADRRADRHRPAVCRG